MLICSAELTDPSTDMHAEDRACRADGGKVVFIDDLVFSSTGIAIRFYIPLLREAWIINR